MKNNILGWLLLTVIVVYVSLGGVAMGSAINEHQEKIDSIQKVNEKFSTNQATLEKEATAYSNRVAEENTLIRELEAELSTTEGLLQ